MTQPTDLGGSGLLKGVEYATRMNLYNLVFWMVFLIRMYQIAHVPLYWEYKKLYPGGDFNFCQYHPTSSVSSHFIYTKQESELYKLYYTNSYFGAAGYPNGRGSW